MRDRRGASVALLVTVFAALVLSLGAWALASAPGSAPDDSYHLSSIWCAQGESDDQCRAVPGDPNARIVPPFVTGQVSCFAGDPLASARCQTAVVSRATPSEITGTGNWTGAYPPIYYWLSSWFVTERFGVSILLIRMFSALVGVGLVAALVALVPSRMRPAAAVPLLVCSIPLGLSLISSTNPSAWGIVAPFVAWLALHASFATSGRRQKALCVLGLAAAVAGSGARADACLFTVMAVLLALLLNWGQLLESRVALLTSAGCIGIGAALFASAGQASALTSGLGADEVLGPAADLSTFELVVFNAAQLPTLWTGSLAVGPMGSIGWLDTVFPPIVGFLTLSSLIALAAWTWRRPGKAHLLAVLLTVGALFIYPLYILSRTNLTVGQGVQPRYLLPITIILVGLVMLAGGARLSTVQAYAIAAALAIANCVALHVQIRRYVTGLDLSDINLDSRSEWWWGMPVGPTFTWILGSIAFAVVAALVLRVSVARGAEQAAG